MAFGIKFRCLDILTAMECHTQASSNDPEEELYETEPFLDDMEFESSQVVNEKLVDEDPPWTPEEKIELPEEVLLGVLGIRDN